MKKALILSLGLAVVFGLTGCNPTDKMKKTVDSATEATTKAVEKPVMVLGDGLKDATDKMSDKADEMAKDAKDAVNNAAEGVVNTGNDMADKAEKMMDEASK